MLPSDLVLIEDPEFKQYVDIYAKDKKLFFKDFAAGEINPDVALSVFLSLRHSATCSRPQPHAAFQKLEELGCKGLMEA